MHFVSVEEWQLLSFFEVEPELRDAGEPWCYNDAAYRVQQADLAISFAIDPAYRDVRIIFTRAEHKLYELNAMGIKDVRYCKDSFGEYLEIIVDDRESLLFRLKPHAELIHRIEVPA